MESNDKTVKYKVKCLALNGKRKRIFRSGESVTHRDFYSGHFEKLLANGSIVEDVVTNVTVGKKSAFGNGKLKVAIVSACWKRPAIFELFARSVKTFEAIDNVEFVTIIAGSEGSQSRKMVEGHGFKYIEIANEPLAEKVNAPVLMAKSLSVDYCFCLGSDDLFTVETMEMYIKQMRLGYDFIGVSDFYFYDTVTRKALYWGGYRESYRQGATCGAGRALSKRLLNKWGWKPWDVRHSLILDNSIDQKLKATKHSKCVFSLKAHGLVATDVKSSTNMTPFEKWDNAEYIEPTLLTQQFPYING